MKGKPQEAIRTAKQGNHGAIANPTTKYDGSIRNTPAYCRNKKHTKTVICTLLVSVGLVLALMACFCSRETGANEGVGKTAPAQEGTTVFQTITGEQEEAVDVEGIIGMGRDDAYGLLGASEASEPMEGNAFLAHCKTQLLFKNNAVWYAGFFSNKCSFRGITVGMTLSEGTAILDRCPDMRVLGLDRDASNATNISYVFADNDNMLNLYYYHDSEIINRFAIVH